MTTGRYLRHTLIDWFDQDAVRAERVVVVGAGAVGNEVIKNLALLGIGRIDVFDLDHVEEHNLTRSVLFRETDVGRAKAQCAAERASDLDPNIEIQAHVGDFWDTLSFDLLGATSVVFSCLDSFEARIRLNRLCALLSVDLVNTGVDSRFAVVETYPFRSQPAGACYECSLPSSAYTAIAQRYSCARLRRVALEERKVPTTILTSSACASAAVSAHLHRGRTLDAPGSRRLLLDTFTGAATRCSLPRQPECPGCGDLDAPRRAARARRRIAPELLPGGTVNGTTVFTSEPILVRAGCRACDLAGRTSSWLVLQPAARFDETFASCPCCGEARELEIRDHFSANDLVARFSGCSMPGKFVTCRIQGTLAVIELEDDDG